MHGGEEALNPLAKYALVLGMLMCTSTPHLLPQTTRKSLMFSTRSFSPSQPQISFAEAPSRIDTTLESRLLPEFSMLCEI
jgi:hypothetical protein